MTEIPEHLLRRAQAARERAAADAGTPSVNEIPRDLIERSIQRARELKAQQGEVDTEPPKLLSAEFVVDHGSKVVRYVLSGLRDRPWGRITITPNVEFGEEWDYGIVRLRNPDTIKTFQLEVPPIEFEHFRMQLEHTEGEP